MIIHNPILTGSFTVNGTDVSSITSSAASLTAINSYTASQNILNGTYATTGSNTFTGIQTVNNNLVVTGSITAQTLVVQTVSSSVIYSSGSNVFGNNIANTQVMTGSMSLTGSLTVVTNGTEFQVNANGVSLGNALTDSHVISGSVRINPNGLFVSSSGLVGIGTSSPNSTLQVLKSGATFQVTDTGKTANNTFSVYGLSQTSWAIATGNSGSFSGGEKIIINDNGNIGIGTTPTYPIHIGSNYANAGSISSGGDLYGTAYFGQSGLIVGTQSTTANIALITYGTNKDILFGSWNGSSNSEKMRITGGGKLLVGRTATIFTNSGHVIQSDVSPGGEPVLEVYNQNLSDSSPAIGCFKNSSTTSSSARFIQFYSNGGTQAMGGIVGNGATNVQFASISDIREKENITSINGSLNKILLLNPVEFDWLKTGEHIKAGFVAQQVEEVFPEYVVENMSNDGEEERKGLTGGMSSGIIAHLTKAIQELQAQITELKNK
jgi:hypothetical protein